MLNFAPRSRVGRTIAVIMIALVSVLGIVLVRTIAMGKAELTTAPTYRVPAIDVSVAATHASAALQFPTISPEDASDTPALERFRAWLMATYPRFHAIARRTVVGKGTLVYEWLGTDASLQPIILMAHQDVVPVLQPESWRYPPFSGTLAEGFIWGRGALDDKTSVIAILEAAESLVAANHTPERSVIFVFGHDEESGGAGARAAAEWLASRAIRAAFVLDEGGLSLTDNPVTGGPATLIGVAEKGYVTLQLAAHAAGGHSNAPGTRTAVDTLAQAIVAIRSNPFPADYAGVTRAMLEALAPHAPFVTRMAIANTWLFEPMLVDQLVASPQAAATLQTTIAPTMLQGSNKQNVLPSIATATINLRILPGESIESVIAHVREALGDLPVTLTRVGPSSEPSAIASTRSRGYRLVAGLAASTFDAPVAPLLGIGITDSRHMTVLSDDIYQYSPFLLGPADIATAHGRDERISIENFGRMLMFYQQVLVGGSAMALP